MEQWPQDLPMDITHGCCCTYNEHGELYMLPHTNTHICGTVYLHFRRHLRTAFPPCRLRSVHWKQRNRRGYWDVYVPFVYYSGLLITFLLLQPWAHANTLLFWSLTIFTSRQVHPHILRLLRGDGPGLHLDQDSKYHESFQNSQDQVFYQPCLFTVTWR